MAFYRGPLAVSYKSEHMRNPVTDADKAAESFLRSSISIDFPGHGILGEEGTGSGVEGSEFTWVLDPVDGTTNFVNSFPFFAVSIGVLHRMVPVAAAVFASHTHIGTAGVFHAQRGGGAFLDDLPLRLADGAKPVPGRLAAVPGSYSRRFKVEKELMKCHGEPRVVGCVALEMSLTAAGVFQFAVFGGPRVWDVAGGLLIVREAGGVILVGNASTGVWEDFESFAPTQAGQMDRTEGLRKWARPVLAGSPGIARFVAQHLTPRPRSEARGRSGSSPASGKPAAQ